MPHGEEPHPGGPVRGFTVVRHGYDRTQVNRYFQQLEASARHASSERDYFQQQAANLNAQLEAARAEIAALTDKVARLGAQPPGDDRSARALAVAKSQASEVHERAKAAAEHSWAAAEQASVELRERYQRLLTELDRQHEEIHAAHQTIMETARAKAEEMTTAAERRRREIDAEAERDRVRIDRDFSESVKTKREALRKELEATRSAAAAEADRLVREARADAERRLREATAEVERLTTLRDQLTGQLRDTHQLVEQVTATLAPAEGEMSFEDTLLLPPPVRADDKP
jgi:membrane protein involved in colicin uptake